MNISLLQQVITDQKNMAARKDRGIKRHVDFNKHLNSDMISVITGVRRSGKSTLMLQLADHFPSYNYINFDDERLMEFSVNDFNSMLIEMKKESDSRIMVMDEIQMIQGWERFVRRIHDEGYKVIISGSNAKLLSSELSTHLTGRYLKTELFPFSFSEYLDFKEIDVKNQSSDNLARVLSAFDNYLLNGGFPEYLKTGIQEVLKRIYDDIVYRDLIVRFGIRNVSGFKNLARYLFTNFTNEAGYLPLAQILGFGSPSGVKDYINMLEEGYLIFEINKFDASLKRQYVSTRKIYVVDNGLRNTVSFRTSEDAGRLLENVVFIELKRRQKEIWYYRNPKNLETDFVVDTPDIRLIQVCYDMSNPKTRHREINSLKSCMLDLNKDEGIILTKDHEEDIISPEIRLKIIPVWKWLLGKD